MKKINFRLLMFQGLLLLLLFACHKRREPVYDIASTQPAEMEEHAAQAQTLSSEQYAANANAEVGPAPPDQGNSTESYSAPPENAFLQTAQSPLSTFSIDVDRASYSNTRRFIQNGQLPPAEAVRAEEMINYFSYNYPQPTGDVPFLVTTEVSSCPWNPKNQLVLIGLQGKKIATAAQPPSNLVFLVDVSGSMNDPNKLPLLKQSLKMLTEGLTAKDRIALVTYAGNAGLVLPSTPGDRKEKINQAIDRLESGGSTAGAQGLELAYELAKEGLISKGNNRVILATDGDFNVGPASGEELVKLIESKRDQNIFLSVLGFGMGNYKDAQMEALADNGNGNYFYIDQPLEAHKVLVKELKGTLFTIAKDVKIQVEFNPARVKSYRLIGYENRKLNNEDFTNDQKDAGEIGAGHSVTAIYEIEPGTASSSGLKYQQTQPTAAAAGNELMHVKLRYKAPDESKSREISLAVTNSDKKFEQASENLRFASSMAAFAMLLRNSPYKGQSSYAWVLATAEKSLGNDDDGYRKQFTTLVSKVQSMVAN